MKDKLAALSGKSIFFLDRDGTLTLGDQLLPGANQLLDTLGKRGKLFYVLTNNSSKTPSEHFSRFKALGMHVSSENVLVSIQAALAYMKQKGYREIFWVATAKQGQYIESSGFYYDETTPDALLLTYDTEITYQKLKKLTFLARKD
ncbi:hypothetical protein GF325_15385, partial [Candidatus Bathyarchaeota archaeon]|nr:hypothetical protein [Candidatus Bathyarchaeota archaeon]